MNYTCNKCGKSMDEINFYTYKNGKKTELCKKCLTMHINNFEPNTFLWALEKMDVPYVPEEWNILRDKAYAKDPYKMNGMSVFGKYLSKMRLKQWKNYSWADTEKIAQEKEKKTQEDLEQQKKFEESMKQQLEKGEISEAEYKTMVSTPTQNAELAVKAPKNEIGTDNFYDENNFISEDELIDPAAELTQEDKIYLAMKWGRLYKPNEWVELEKKYEEMTSSFDIQDSDTTGTLILICKTYLKMNQAIDCGDMDGYQKLSRVYDSLRKSAKFTAAQNKEVKSDFVDCIGEMVAYCEKNGGQIPRMKIEAPNDIVDKVIMDLKEYTRSLIYDDKSLAQQIENYIKQRENADAMKKDREEAKEKGYNQIELKDRDYQTYFDNIAKEKENDEKIYIGEDEDFI
jgi:hypothetical protein